MDDTQLQMEQTSPIKSETVKKNTSKPSVFFVGVGAGAVLLVLFVLVVTGVLYIGVKQPGQKVTAQVHVCNTDDIAVYNSALGFDSTQAENKASQTLEKLGKSIKSRKDNGRDITCQYILWHYAAFMNDKAAQKTYLTNIVTLSNKGAAVSSSIKSIESIETMQTLTNQQDTTEEQGQG